MDGLVFAYGAKWEFILPFLVLPRFLEWTSRSIATSVSSSRDSWLMRFAMKKFVVEETFIMLVSCTYGGDGAGFSSRSLLLGWLEGVVIWEFCSTCLIKVI